MKHLSQVFLLTFCCLSVAFAQQKDTVYVAGFYESGGIAPDNYGTLNNAIDQAREDGTINNTVFSLTPYDVYVLTKGILLDQGQNLEIVAPKPLRADEADAQTVQNSAPPQIFWTEETIDRAYIIQTYGNVTMKNIWIRFADFLGSQVASSITFEDSLTEAQPKEYGYFEGCIFDYNGIGSEGSGTISVKADHFNGTFIDCYWRNQSDIHFQYYGRAVSFPYQSSGFHYDSLMFENCTFSNISRIVMQEGNEYGDNIHINHCTLINSIEWVYQSAGWLNKTSITNSIFVNPNLMGYRAIDVCDDDQDYDDFEDGLCDPPGGGLLNGITAVDSFGFQVDFTDLNRQLYIAHNAYMYQDWIIDWFAQCDWCKEQITSRHPEEIHHPLPMIGEEAMAFIDSVDENGNKYFTKLNVDMATIYDEDPGFLVEPTNQDTLQLFIEGRWGTGLDIDWAYEPYAGQSQTWPLPEDLAYSNEAYKTAAMGGFPLGDLNWYPDQLAAWEAQRDTEWETINSWLQTGSATEVKELGGPVPGDYTLEQNYPNPFNPTTTIEYTLPQSGHVTLKVFNTTGQEVATLIDGEQQAGSYQAIFDATALASGTYLYRLKAGDVVVSKKFVLMK